MWTVLRFLAMLVRWFFEPFKLPDRGTETRVSDAHHNAILSVAFSPNGALLATTDAVSLKLWDVRSGVELRSRRETAFAAAFDPSGDTLLVVSAGVWLLSGCFSSSSVNSAAASSSGVGSGGAGG